MGLIYKEVVLKGDKGGGRFHALWDNGSSESFIRRDLAEEVGTILKLDVPREFEMGKGTLSVEESTGILSVQVEGYNLFWHFLVVPNLSEELIIGADFLQRWKIKLDPESEKIIIDPKALKLKLVTSK
ncbi:MAG: retroviral-like aspartic protease [Methanophagales archaeon ANME-1-THS]|nr:MAG: retroviral-like aspartic protease [Methanophagales archaeon ANME-1-THS]